eukprot:SAG31_NODE_6642_length_1942_cov_1.176886_1_plen_163_part_00
MAAITTVPWVVMLVYFIVELVSPSESRVVLDTSNRPPPTANDLLREHALKGQLDELKSALAAGANLYDVDIRGHSALQNAAVKGHANVVAYILSLYAGAEQQAEDLDSDASRTVDSVDNAGRTALFDAVRFGHVRSRTLFCQLDPPSFRKLDFVSLIQENLL